MELPRQQFGRRVSTTEAGQSTTATRPNNGAFSSAVPPSPTIPQLFESSAAPSAPGSTQIPVHTSLQTPRLSNTPKLHQRKDSTPSNANPPTSSIWSRLFGIGGGARRASATSKGGQFAFGEVTGSRPLTSRPYADSRGPGGQSPPLLLLVRNIVLRPFYVLSRRGPLVPLISLIIILAVYFTNSTSSSSQTVKLRVQGALGPYIPQRAADAIDWAGNVRQQPLWGGRDDAAGAAGGRQARNFGKPNKGGLHGGSAVDELSNAVKELPRPRKDGRLLLKEGKEHPIPLLMKRARAQWDALKGRQSKTFAEAVKEYIRRHGRRPPKGFDKWYSFAKSHKVLLIDEFDFIEQELLKFRAFRPANFRARVQYLAETYPTVWTVKVENGKLERTGELKDHDRARGVTELSSRFAHVLPDLEMVYNGHDGARIALAYEERHRLELLAKAHQYEPDVPAPFDPQERGPEPHHSVPVFCPPGTAVREPTFDYGWAPPDSTGLEMPPLPEDEEAIGTLIDNFKQYMNLCESPQYRHFHATTSWVYQHHPTPVLPLLTPGVQHGMGDIPSLIVEQLDLEAQHDPTWEERPFTSLQWRGQTSGPLWEKTTPWRTTQRARLHLLSHQEDGSRKTVLTDAQGKMHLEDLPNYRLNPLFLDTGMVGPAVQCVKEDGTCDEMERVFQGYDKRISFDRASLYKYVLDVDGNSWSGRFRRLMLSNAAVVKATIFPEFWTDWIIPWLHFIPMQVDYSDMWDIMAFFRGGIDGRGAHDELGKEIADEGKAWVKQCYRRADLEAYQFRLMLEYGRLYNDETESGSNDYTGDGSIEPPAWNGPIKLD